MSGLPAMFFKGVRPERASAHSAGYDLTAAAADTIEPGRWGVVPTGTYLAIPEGWYGRIAARSGLAVRHGLMINAGVVDSDYRGEILVVLHNAGPTAFEVVPGERIAQLILERHGVVEMVECAELPETVRGAAGFGSTGSSAMGSAAGSATISVGSSAAGSAVGSAAGSVAGSAAGSAANSPRSSRRTGSSSDSPPPAVQRALGPRSGMFAPPDMMRRASQ